ncbi:hypothetical protein AGLY_005160 [Aphis glycines]|uniref:Uncharacterized protein n=1 Tax=Aphis glycines TaxID=307491 RepID=A0A6G0TVY4_APHGL|nr:hypothetical protein AGLY_005160 [Aphis glycines]
MFSSLIWPEHTWCNIKPVYIQFCLCTLMSGRGQLQYYLPNANFVLGHLKFVSNQYSISCSSLTFSKPNSDIFRYSYLYTMRFISYKYIDRFFNSIILFLDSTNFFLVERNVPCIMLLQYKLFYFHQCLKKTIHIICFFRFFCGGSNTPSIKETLVSRFSISVTKGRQTVVFYNISFQPYQLHLLYYSRSSFLNYMYHRILTLQADLIYFSMNAVGALGFFKCIINLFISDQMLREHFFAYVVDQNLVFDTFVGLANQLELTC